MEPLTASSLLVGLLRLLGDGALHAPAALAQQLGVSEPLVTAMTETLARRGYLAPVSSGCGTSCAGCGCKQACHVAPALLALTPKGVRAAAGLQRAGRPPGRAGDQPAG